MPEERGERRKKMKTPCRCDKCKHVWIGVCNEAGEIAGGCQKGRWDLGPEYFDNADRSSEYNDLWDDCPDFTQKSGT